MSSTYSFVTDAELRKGLPDIVRPGCARHLTEQGLPTAIILKPEKLPPISDFLDSLKVNNRRL